MPLYEFFNKETGEYEEHFVKMDEKKKFLKKNKHLTEALSSFSIGDPIRLGVRKNPDSVKDLFRKIGKKSPGNKMSHLY